MQILASRFELPTQQKKPRQGLNTSYNTIYYNYSMKLNSNNKKLSNIRHKVCINGKLYLLTDREYELHLKLKKTT